MPRLSIITVTFNLIEAGREQTLMQAVDSVQMQRFRDFEHLVVDGNSTDGTVALLEGLQSENKITRYVSEPDSGLYDAMNKGVSLASGDYVLFLNSDDFYHDDNAFGLIDAASRNIPHHFVCSPVVIADAHKPRVKTVSTFFMRVLFRMPFGHPGLAVTRRLFQDLGGFDTSYRIAADYDFILRMLLQGTRGAVLKSSFATFRAGGVSEDMERSEKEKIEIWRRHYARFHEASEQDLVRLSRSFILPTALSRAIIVARGVPPNLRLAALIHYVRAVTNV